MFDPKGLQALAAVLQCGSFEKAASQLFITQSAVSQRIKQLEVRTGHTLLLRSSPPRVTPAGASVVKYVQQLEQLEQALYADLKPAEQKGWSRLSLAVNADTLVTWLLTDCLSAWAIEENVLLDLKIDDQDQTHHLLQNGSVTGCISAREAPPQGCRSHALGVVKYICVASPDFRRKWFTTKIDKAGFQRAPFVRFNEKDLLQHNFLMRHFKLDGDQLPMHMMPSSNGFVEWVRLGMGWGMAPTSQVEKELEAGELIELTPGKYSEVKLYWHLWGLDTPLTLSLTNALKTAARKALD